MIASVLKRKKIKGKVILLDHNHDIKIKGEGFHAAFEELYKDYIEYYPSITIVGVDVENKTVIDEFDDYRFDDAAIYPRIRGSKLIETLGLVNDTSPQKEARINQYRNNLIDDERVYVIGDSRSTGYSKSGSTAQAEARYVARVIAARIKGEEIEWQSPYTSCYSMVGAEPMEAIYFGSEYLPPQADITAMSMERTISSWTDTGAAFAWRDRNMLRSAEMGEEMIGWAITHYKEMFE
jgi:NADH dehydrogenase FAD-containing subunit